MCWVSFLNPTYSLTYLPNTSLREKKPDPFKACISASLQTHDLNGLIFGLHLELTKNHGPDICPARDLWGTMLQGSFVVCFKKVPKPDDVLPLN